MCECVCVCDITAPQCQGSLVEVMVAGREVTDSAHMTVHNDTGRLVIEDIGLDYWSSLQVCTHTHTFTHTHTHTHERGREGERGREREREATRACARAGTDTSTVQHPRSSSSMQGTVSQHPSVWSFNVCLRHGLCMSGSQGMSCCVVCAG